MRRRLVQAFLLVAAAGIAEVAVFVLVARWLGLVWAVLLVLVASLSGAVLVRREGGRAWRRLRQVGESGAPPGPQVIDGVIGLAGALLLSIPGLLSGLAGALLLVPPVRRLVRVGAARRAERRISSAQAGDLFGPRRVRVRPGRARPESPQPPTPTIEGEIVDPDPPRQ